MRYFSALDVSALAKPEIGTKVPAPHFWAILSKTPIPVNKAARKIIVTSIKVNESFSLIENILLYKSKNN